MKKILGTVLICGMVLFGVGSTVLAEEQSSENSPTIESTEFEQQVENEDSTNVEVYSSNEVTRTKIFDKDGNEIELEPLSPKMGLERGTQIPTSTKTLNIGNSYQSNGFSGSGRRYSGYRFRGGSARTFQLIFKKGGFGVVCDEGTANIKADRTPCYLQTNGSFYFAVDNPISGQTYYVKGTK